MFARIIVDIVNSNVDRKFDYLIPDNIHLSIGQAVLVPFAGKMVEGIVLELSEQTDIDINKIKCIEKVIDENSVITDEQIYLCEYLQKKYRIPLSAAIRTVLPSSIRKKIKSKTKKLVTLAVSLDTALSYVYDKKGKVKYSKQYEFIMLLNKNGFMYYTSAYSDVIKALSLRNIVNIEELYSEYDYNSFKPARLSELELTEKQTDVFNRFISSNHLFYLLHGVTGSGKTEIYIRAIRDTLQKGKNCILLVPEISLTPQTFRYVAGRLDCEIALFHSGLTDAERYNEWKKVMSGNARLVIGARSAVFAPLKNIGLIIIDEEHENSYKADNYPKYTAHEIAKLRCEYNCAKLILGSATPSVISYYNAINGLYELLELKERVNGIAMPQVHIADMKVERKKGNISVLSSLLKSKIEEALKNNKQVIIFHNRRGYSNYVMCYSCGNVIRCDACAVSMTYHKSINKLKCHYCGRTTEIPVKCPVCGKPYIKFIGSGTQRLEEELKENFPSAKILRMDLDTTTRKDSHKIIYDSFANKEADILIGTQMITKGFDFENVVLSGIINSDNMLNFPDYRSNEDTFMCITQVAGRSGRKGYGEVVLQTCSPENFVIKCSSLHDYSNFYQKEIEIRRLSNMPPFSNLIKITFSGNDENKIIAAVKDFLSRLSSSISDKSDILNINAGESGIKRINNYIYYEINICLKNNVQHDTINIIKNEFESSSYKGILVGLDME